MRQCRAPVVVCGPLASSWSFARNSRSLSGLPPVDFARPGRSGSGCSRTQFARLARAAPRDGAPGRGSPREALRCPNSTRDATARLSAARGGTLTGYDTAMAAPRSGTLTATSTKTKQEPRKRQNSHPLFLSPFQSFRPMVRRPNGLSCFRTFGP